MRKTSLGLVGTVAIIMVTAVGAWACTNLATLNLSQSAVNAGQTIDVTGSSFRTAERGGQVVRFHWNGPEGELLAEAEPDASGQVRASVTIPAEAQAGFYVLVATQNVMEQEGHVEAGGLSPAFGTPARATVQVGDPAPRADLTTPASTAGAGDSGSGALLALTSLLAVVGIGLFGAGISFYMRDAHRRPVPQAARQQD